MYQILTDSGCDLPQQLLDDHQIQTVPFHYTVNGTLHTDRLGDRQSTDDVYAQLHAAADVSTTQINVGEYEAFFRPFVAAGTPILYIGFCGALSGSLASAQQARELLKEEYPDAQIAIVDSLAASGGEGLLVLNAARQQAAGASLEAVVNWLEAHKRQMNHWVTVDDLDHLARGGRLPRAIAALGTMLNIKPLLSLDASGQIQLAGKVRSRKKALSTLAAKGIAALADDPTQPLIVASAGDWPAADAVAAQIQAAVPDATLILRPVSLTIATHTGYGCVAVFGMTMAARS
ncbi:DegV family protein [Lacticaseibacillus daqingensis]|uniref:DegV family protein n=1 Tax=Lacticaseibacillus daqingensis TaxID=2486014 RepID=UPI0013DD9720|nr:DegV family protein [Lacticaseibacillus daqingensis]